MPSQISGEVLDQIRVFTQKYDLTPIQRDNLTIFIASLNDPIFQELITAKLIND